MVTPVQGLGHTLQMQVVEATPERVVMTMPVTAQHLQPWGYLHGGASVALAETAATAGAFLNCPAGMVAFGQEINANHLRSVREGLLTATATPLHIGRMSQVWEIDIRDEQQKRVCVSRCTLAVIASDAPLKKGSYYELYGVQNILNRGGTVCHRSSSSACDLVPCAQAAGEVGVNVTS